MTQNLDDVFPGVYSEVPEVLHELFARLPYGQKIKLSNGREFTFEKMSKKPYYHVANGWCFTIDARFEQGPGLDHLEITVNHTGGGGFVQSDGSISCEPEGSTK